MMKIEVSSVCDLGKKRAQNQDVILTYTDNAQDFALFLVADGMGGHINGDKASNTIVDGMRVWLEQIQACSTETAAKLLSRVRDEMKALHKKIQREWGQYETCGSTCVLLLFKKDMYGLFSVGDSRIYLVRGIHCETITKDDVWENQASVRERYSEKELHRHPNYGKLLHAVGSDGELVYAMETGEVRRGDVFMLCSDGIYKMCTSRFLRRKLITCRRRDLDSVRDEIMGKVYENGAKDNASLILVRCR